MADPSPLLPESPPLLSKHAAAASIDDTIEQCVGNAGITQLLLAVLISSAWIFDAQQVFISVFTDSNPTWHCVDLEDHLCSNATTPCGLREGSWAWDQPAHTSVVSEWGLECYSSTVAGIPASAFFVGCLVGGVALATLADSTLGRKKMLWMSCMAMSAFGIMTAFSPNLWVYSGFRFINGIFRATIGTSAMVLSTEIIGKRWRGQVSVMGFFLFTVGFISLPAIAYIGRGSSWRNLYLWTSIPGLCYSFLIIFFTHESPRWLLVRGRREEAIQTLRKMASSSGHQLSDSSFDHVEFDEVVSVDGHGGMIGVSSFSGLKILLEAKWALRRLTALMAVSFGIGMVYYGMPLGVGNLGFNLYFSVTFNALSELPSSLLVFFLVETLNRRSTLLVTTLASGLACITCVFIKNYTLRMAMELTAFFGTCTSFTIALIYALELFPTCVRNSAVAMVRQGMVLGGVFAPVLVASGRDNGLLSYGVFGLVIACCGLFVVCLPETRGSGICDTMEEQEYKEIVAVRSPKIDDGSCSP